MLKSASSSSSSSLLHTTRHYLLHTVSGAIWFPVIISGCMSVYVVGASRQGLKWFSPKHNPYLHLQLFAGAAATAASFYLMIENNNNNKSNNSSTNEQPSNSSSSSDLAQIFLRPHKNVVLLAAASWSVYSALITKQRLHFREWRYIISAHVPLVALFGVYMSL